MNWTSGCRRVVWGLMGVVVSSVSVLGAEPADQQFYRAYYMEHAKGDLRAAAELYTAVVEDRRAGGALLAQAQARLAAVREEVAASDLTRLMPPGALAYVEITRPGEQLMKLLDQLGLLSDGGLPPADGKRHVAVSPSLIRETLGIGGAAIAVTGFNPVKGAPSGVAVFHHGDLEVIRGLLETGLPMGAKPAEPLGGYPTYDIEGEVYVTLTPRLVVASTERAPILNVLRRLTGELKSSLATSGALAEYAERREDSLVFFMINAKSLMPIIKTMAGATGASRHDLEMVDALVDLDSLQSLTGQIRVSDEGVSLEASLRLAEGHRSLVYNFLRTPAIHQETLRCVPEGAAAFAVSALNEAPSRFGKAMAPGDTPPIVTLLDIGREIFANITSFAVFVLGPEGNGSPGGGPIPDAGLVLTVNDPSKSEALWTQILGIASLATGAGAIEGASTTIEEVHVRSFALPEGITVYFATIDHDVVVATSKSAMRRSIAAKRDGKSVLSDGAMAEAISQINRNTTKGMFVHAGRCATICRPFMSGHGAAELDKFMDRLSETVVSLTVEHSDQVLRFSASATGLPDVSDVIAQYINEEMEGQERAALVRRAMKSGKWESALEMVDAALASEPGSAEQLQTKFRILAICKKDRDAAVETGEAFLAANRGDANALNNFAWALLTNDAYGAGEYADLAMKLSQRSNDITDHENWMFVDTLALAKFETGDVDAAIKLEKKAIELTGGKGNKGLNQALARFEATAREGALAGGQQ